MRSHEKISSANISEILRGLQKVASGVDSEVFIYRNYVLKRYLNLDVGDIRKYKKATEEAAKIINNKTIDTVLGKVKVLVTPIQRIIEPSENMGVIAVSKLIKGTNPNDMLIKREIDKSEFNAFSASLEELSRMIIRGTVYRGINIIPWNTMLANRFGKIYLYVTDICPRVSNLK